MQKYFQIFSLFFLSHSADSMASQAKTRVGVCSQRDGAFMRVVIKSDVELLYLVCDSLVLCKQCWVLWGALKMFPSLDVYIFVIHIRASCMTAWAHWLNSPCGQGFWFLLLFQLVSMSRAKSDWPTICGLRLECPRLSFLKLPHPWTKQAHLGESL